MEHLTLDSAMPFIRKVILFISTSLDGFIAGPNGEIDWLFTDQDYETFASAGPARF